MQKHAYFSARPYPQQAEQNTLQPEVLIKGKKINSFSGIQMTTLLTPQDLSIKTY